MLPNYSSAAFIENSGVQVSALAEVEVRLDGDGGGALASLFEDYEGTVPLDNPFEADAEGRFSFYVANRVGGYQVKVTDPNTLETHTLRHQVVLNPSALGAQLLEAASAAAVRSAIGLPSAMGGFTLLNGYLVWSVSGNVLTVAVKNMAGNDPSADDPVHIVFRNPTAGSGVPVVRSLTAATSISINNTATLGTANSTAFRLWCVAFDDGGTIRLGLINCLSGTNIYPLAGWGIASSTLEDDAADSAHVFYSAGAAVASKAYATLGHASWESGLATAGTWSAAPTRVSLFGLGMSLPGQMIQEAAKYVATTSVISTTIPLDDTIPQITEGSEWASQAITPTSAANIAEVESHIMAACASSASHFTNAVFRSGTANALRAVVQRSAAEEVHSCFVRARVLTGTSSPSTFSARAARTDGNNLRLNGVAGNQLFGGAAGSYLMVREIMA